MSMKNSFSRVLEHFLDRRFPFVNAPQSILPERRHAELDRLLFQDDRRRALVDQLADRVGDVEQLVDALAAFVTGLVTSLAPFAVVKILVADLVRREHELRERRL